MPPSHQGDAEHWKTPFCYPGEDSSDCPRACFLGCDQFGRTRYRLDELDRNGNPMDMTKYKGCNTPCWNYCLLCFGGLYIGSGVYTGKQTHQIRKKYRILGNYGDDIAKGIFCQPCSLIRNDVEIRRREGLNLRLEDLAPMPLGENRFQPMYSMTTGNQNKALPTLPINEEYRPEPKMGSKPGAGRREVRFHEPLEVEHSPRTVTVVADVEEFQYPNTQLPEIPDVGSPLSIGALSRRLQALTPISEGEMGDDSHHKENKPRLAQVHDWLHYAGQPLTERFPMEEGVMRPGPRFPPPLRLTGKESPEPSSNGTTGLQLAGDTKPASTASEPVDMRNIPRRAVTYLPATRGFDDTLMSTPMMANLNHDIEHDSDVRRPTSGPQEGHDRSQDQKFKYIKLTDPEHNLSQDKHVEYLKLTDPKHDLSQDKRVDYIKLTDEPPQSSEHFRRKDHSSSQDSNVLQRAYRMLEQLLAQDEKSSDTSDKSR